MKPHNQPPILSILDLKKSYSQSGKAILALNSISLKIEKGDVYGIIGLSGAGKSTLIRCLATLIEPSSGTILFHGTDLNKLTKESLRLHRQKIGMIFQHFNLLSARTVAENIAYPLEIAHIPQEEIGQRVEELLGLVGLLKKKDAYPSQLSGGEKQRVGIARALANRPELLLCDEATSALDPRTTQEILDLLKTVNRNLGVTIVLITHDMKVIQKICSQVAVIEKGEIVEKGTVAEVFSDPSHPTTKHLIQSASHEIPKEFFKPFSPNRKLLRLKFKGSAAEEPLISQITKNFQVEANILLGWIDHLQTIIIGTLVIELTGTSDGIEKALAYLSSRGVHFEVLEHAK